MARNGYADAAVADILAKPGQSLWRRALGVQAPGL
jgi:hypothetical protein